MLAHEGLHRHPSSFYLLHSCCDSSRHGEDRFLRLGRVEESKGPWWYPPEIRSPALHLLMGKGRHKGKSVPGDSWGQEPESGMSVWAGHLATSKRECPLHSWSSGKMARGHSPGSPQTPWKTAAGFLGAGWHPRRGGLLSATDNLGQSCGRHSSGQAWTVQSRPFRHLCITVKQNTELEL